jgi:hypothetical protein
VSDDQDWRLKAEVDVEGKRGVLDRLLRGIRDRDIAAEVAADVSHDVAITHDGENLLFAYAATNAELTTTRAAIEAAVRRDGLTASVTVSHWDDELDEWAQVDPPLAGSAKEDRQAAVRDAEQPESRTMVASTGKLIRTEVEQTMRDWANKLNLQCEIIEHPHLLTTQVAFTVTGSKRKVDEFAAGLRAEELATMRTERAVMMSPL